MVARAGTSSAPRSPGLTSGLAFDVQGGGSDLVFPHHEMSASEAQVADPGSRFAQAYVHAGMVGLDGEKMSKSKGNLVLVSTLRESGLDPMVIRLVLLGHHYRSDWQWDEADVSAAGARLDKWRGAVAKPAGAPTAHVVTDVLTALASDLDAPFALRLLDHWANATDFGDDSRARRRRGHPGRGRLGPRRSALSWAAYSSGRLRRFR